LYGIIYKKTSIQVKFLFCQKCFPAENYLKNFNNCTRKRSNWNHYNCHPLWIYGIWV